METADNRRVATRYQTGYNEYLGLVPKDKPPPLLGSMLATEVSKNLWIANCFAGESLDGTLACLKQVAAFCFAVRRIRKETPEVRLPRHGHSIDDILLFEIATFAIPDEIQVVLVT